MKKRWTISDEYKKVSIEILLDNLAPLRAKLNLTQEELASVLGVSRQTYYGIETRNKEMPWAIYLALIFFFDSVRETSEMIRELRIFPIELVMHFNDDPDAPSL